MIEPDDSIIKTICIVTLFLLFLVFVPEKQNVRKIEQDCQIVESNYSDEHSKGIVQLLQCSVVTNYSPNAILIKIKSDQKSHVIYEIVGNYTILLCY